MRHGPSLNGQKVGFCSRILSRNQGKCIEFLKASRRRVAARVFLLMGFHVTLSLEDLGAHTVFELLDCFVFIVGVIAVVCWRYRIM